MIYITGDTHGEYTRFIENNMEDSEWTADDTLIVCGDFGFVFRNNEAEQRLLDLLEKKPYTVCFCDGNHENFHALFSYPEEEWCGGRTHRIRKNIRHLMRGQVFELEGKKLFTMGGAYSIDRFIRKLGYSYWTEEIPCDTEYKEAVKNLEKHSNEVDIVISHTAPRELIRRMGAVPDMHDAELTGFLEWIMYSVKFSHWYYGHWHIDKTFDERYTAVYFDVHKI